MNEDLASELLEVSTDRAVQAVSDVLSEAGFPLPDGAVGMATALLRATIAALVDIATPDSVRVSTSTDAVVTIEVLD